MYIITENERRGKRLVIITICISLGFSIFNLINYSLYITNVGTDRVLSQVSDVILSLILSYYLYKGSKWVKILVGILMILSSLLYLIRIVEAVLVPLPISLFIIFMIAAFIIHFTFGILLLSSRSIKSFMEFQKRKLN